LSVKEISEKPDRGKRKCGRNKEIIINPSPHSSPQRGEEDINEYRKMISEFAYDMLPWAILKST